jgi:hypothetical protein
MNVSSSQKFENIILGARNQLLLKKCAVQMCKEKNVNIPRSLVHYLIYYSIVYLEEKASTHKFSNKKISWLNTEIMTKFLTDIESVQKTKSYWAKAELEKNVREQKRLADAPKKVIEVEEEKVEFSGKFKKFSNKKLSDLYNYT